MDFSELLDLAPLFFLWIGIPLLIGAGILVFSGQGRLARLAGFFTLKPVLAIPLWMGILLLESGGFENEPAKGMISIAISLIPGVILTAIIVYSFRDTFKTSRLAYWFLLGDVIRWGNTFVLYLIADVPELLDIFEGLLLMVSAVMGLFSPSLYAIIILIVLGIRWGIVRTENKLRMDHRNA